MTMLRTGLANPRIRMAGLLAATILSAGVSNAAFAQPITGLYLGGAVGYNYMGSTSGSVDKLPGRSSPPLANSEAITINYKGGFGLLGSVGYGVGNGVRLEGEFSYRSNGQSGSSGATVTSTQNNQNTTTPTSTSTGTEVKYGLMANVLYDFSIGQRWVYPYVGVGFGYQLANWSKIAISTSGIDYGNIATTVSPSGTIGQIAYQVILGASFPIEAVPGLSASLEYRFMGLAGNRNYSGTGYTQYISSAYKNNQTKVHVSSDNNQSFLVGFRYAFNPDGTYAIPATGGAGPALATAVPAPANVSRTYLVFFDFDRSDLSARARDIVAEAVRASASVPHTRIDVSGNTDSAGDPAYNQRLSLARAQSVAAEMGRWGVPGSAIDIHGYGDSRPLVPTGPGTREPQNRRVEIVYR